MSDPESRKLKPIYDAIDTGSYRLAIQNCDKLLKKQPKHETIRALKSLALLRSNKAEEAIRLCDELLASKPADETVLGVLSHVLKALERTPEITTMYEEAYKKHPTNEELGAQAFMAMIRVGLWKNAQVTAFKIYKSFKHVKYLFWSIMAAVLQAQNAGGIAPGPTDNAPMLLTLALRMVASSPVPSLVSADHFYLHLTILKSLDQIDEAYQLIQSERGKRLCNVSLVIDELRREIFQAKGACKEEAVLSGERLSRQNDRNWITFLSLINSTFDVIKISESQTKIGTDLVAPPAESSNAGHPPMEQAPHVVNDSLVPGEPTDPDLELTPKAAPPPELPLDPPSLIGGLRELFERLSREDGTSERGAHLALLLLEKKIRSREEGQGTPLASGFTDLLKQYFANFSNKACCFEDLKPYVADLRPTEVAEWTAFLAEEDQKRDLSSTNSLQRVINVMKLRRFSATDATTDVSEHEAASDYLKAYFEGLPLGANLLDTDLQYADDLAVLSINALISAWSISKNQSYLHQALVVLEYATQKSKQSYTLKILAIRIYRLLGANAPAIQHYHRMDVKQVQTDTLSYLILSRGSTFSLAATGHLGMMSECITASEIYTQNSTETADMIARAFQHEKYSQITEFVEFEDRLDNSLQRDLTRIEYVRMKFTTEKLEPEALLMELQELEFVLEKMHHDNRDFAIIPNYQPRGQSVADQTSMGVVRGFQWLTVFLQLYIRAYARACRVETATAGDLSTFLTSWLSEMTDDEKAFLEFSQILHEWIPCPPLQSREAALAALGATIQPAEGQNGDAANAGGASGQDKAKAESSPPPHVKKDGSAPVTVEASAESASKYFENAVSRTKSLLTDQNLLWEAFHVATLAQEAFILLQIVSLPYTTKSSKLKKLDHSIVDSLKTVSSQAAAQLKDLAAALEDWAKAEGAVEKQDAFVKDCESLDVVDAALGPQYAESIAKLTLNARIEMADGLGKGIRKVVTGH